MSAIDAMLYHVFDDKAEVGSSVIVDLHTGYFDGTQAFGDMLSVTEDDTRICEHEYLLIGQSRLEIETVPGSADGVMMYRVSSLDALKEAVADLDLAMSGAADAREPQLSEAQRKAVASFRDAKGADWKDTLSAVWASGNYRRHGVASEQAAALQQVRNLMGPQWLEEVTDHELDQPTHTKVSADHPDLSM